MKVGAPERKLEKSHRQHDVADANSVRLIALVVIVCWYCGVGSELGAEQCKTNFIGGRIPDIGGIP